MLNPKFVRFVSLIGLLSLPAAALFAGSAVAQVPDLPTSGDTLEELPSSDDIRPLSEANTLLSIAAGRRLIDEATQAFNGQNYGEATRKLQEARQLFNQLTNFYQDLFNSFTGVDNRIADSLRRQAFDTAQLRDEATYQLALVHRAQNQPELAVPLLIQIVRSQQPTRDLGQRAYRQLFELGFVDSAYPRTQDTGATPPANVPN
ncbi:hypothetical protein ACQ4M4_13535 [Leptolyngbya sp. AN02str]|uniref:hypothetical protein n=1 Tax=Leptolyngbya sp. AN02str TaxID=3423363 RepID=UPI003D322410